MKTDAPSTSPPKAPSAADATKAEDRVSIPQRLAYSCGIMSDGIGIMAIGNLANPVFNIMLGVNPAWLGIAKGLARFFDAFTDPLMGHISDNFKSRWGRRKPFLALGSVLMAVFFAGLWMIPEGFSKTGYFIYFCLFSTLYYAAHTVFMVPYTAIGYQMTPDYQERTRVMAVRAVFQQATQIMVPWILAIAYLDFFGDPKLGIRWTGAFAAILIIVTGLTCARFVQERDLSHSLRRKDKLPLFKSFAIAFKNKPFVIKMSAYLMHFVGNVIPLTLGFYVLAYYVCEGDVKRAAYWQGLSGSLGPLIGIAVVPLVTWYALRYGKKSAFLIGALLMVPAGIVTWFCAVPGSPWLFLISAPINGLSVSFLSVLNSAIVADICDYDELQTGRRREAVFGSVNSWVSKSGVSVALIFSGFILAAVGFDAELGPAQKSDTLTNMRLWLSGAIISKGLLAFWIFSYFSLTPEKMRQVRAELELGRSRNIDSMTATNATNPTPLSGEE